MKNIKKLALSLVSMFMLVGCGDTHTHAFDTYQKDESQHWTVCECGEETEHVDHEYEEAITKAADCENKGEKTYTCVCGASFTKEIDAIGHSWDEGKITTEPGASTPGVKTYTCSNCGDTKTESIDPTCAITVDETVVKEGYSTVYRIDVNSETLGFETELEVSDMELNVKVAYKIVDGGAGVFYEPVIGGTKFQWTTNEENAGGWANVYDMWYEGDAKLTAEGKLTVGLNDYEGRKFAAGAKIYIAVELVKFSLTTTTEVTFGEGYTVHEIKVLKDTGTFQVALPVGEANADVTAAVQVAEGTTWIGFIGGNISAPVYFRPAWNTGDWWEPFNRFREFTGKSDANGNLVVEIQKYDADLTAGTTVHVATKVAPKIKYAIEESTEHSFIGYKVYDIKVTAPTLGFELDLPVGKAGDIVVGKVTVTAPTATYIEPYVNGTSLNWFNEGQNWWHEYGTWVDFAQATLGENGSLAIKIADYGTELPTGTVISVAVANDNGLGYMVTEEPVTVDGYAVAFAVTVVRENTVGFETKLEGLGDANLELSGKAKLTVPEGTDPQYVNPIINTANLDWFLGTDGWSKAYDTWFNFGTALDAEGSLGIALLDYSGWAFPVGMTMHVVLKVAPTTDFSTYKSTMNVPGYTDVYVVEINKEVGSIETDVVVGEAGKEIEGTLTIFAQQDRYYEPYINGTSLNFFKIGQSWWNECGVKWVGFTATLDDNGAIHLLLKDYQDAKLEVGLQVAIAVKAKTEEIVKVSETTDVTYGEGYTVYAIEVVATNDGNFEVLLPVAEAGTKVVGAMTCGGTYDDFLCVFTNGFDDFKFWHATISYGGGWSYLNGEWREFEQTTDAEGCIKVTSKRYVKDVTPGAIIYVAVKTAA